MRKESLLSAKSTIGMVFRAAVMLTCLVVVPLVAVFGTSIRETIKQVLDRQLGIRFNVFDDAHPALTDAPPFVPHAAPSYSNAGTGTASVPASGRGFEQPPNFLSASTPETTRPIQDSAVIPTSFQTPVVMDLSAPPPAASPTTDRFTYLDRRLREWGATYCQLETWGSAGQLYRFCCKMAIGGSPNCTRYFEATAPDPLQAMSNVVGQVEAWRAGR